MKVLESLGFIDLKNRFFIDLKPLENLTNLKYLDLSNTNVKNIEPLAALTNLQELDLSLCDWIQQSLELPKNLMSLSFLLKSMTTIPNLSNLTNLVDLDIRIVHGGSPVQEPNIEWLVMLHALKKLSLVVNDMILPPTNLSSLSQLQELQITCVDRSRIGLPSSLQK